MLARINILFAFSILTLLAFYFGGRLVLVEIVEALAPPLVPYFIAAYILVALMLTVLIVAKTTIRLEAVSMASRTSPASARSVAAQGLLCAAHLSVLFAIYVLFAIGGDGAVHWPWLLPPLLYAAGIYLAIIDFQKRASQAVG
ncbi:MAG: hypothetical protein JSW48_01265 [Betaproteobacteria bacterium]|jgi:hypothetical protein|nr:MAG: hypothetical protein JSW48_01265 [Betaproteobacteria bacterium]